jgi:hypothetical protein
VPQWKKVKRRKGRARERERERIKYFLEERKYLSILKGKPLKPVMKPSN